MLEFRIKKRMFLQEGKLKEREGKIKIRLIKIIGTFHCHLRFLKSFNFPNF